MATKKNVKPAGKLPPQTSADVKAQIESLMRRNAAAMQALA